MFAASAAEELKPCAEFKSINMKDGANLAANPAFKRNGAPWLPRRRQQEEGELLPPQAAHAMPPNSPYFAERLFTTEQERSQFAFQ